MLTTIKKKKKTILFVLSIIVLLVFYYSKQPNLNGNWSEPHKVLPVVSISGDDILIDNLRDFTYNADKSIKQANYRSRKFQLSRLKRFWFGLSHFGKFGMAHAFVSFEFHNDKFLVVSIEARLKDNQTFNPVSAVSRQYTKALILSTEQDVIGLRSHIRGEKVYLYELEMSALKMRSLLLNYLGIAQDLSTQAEFYNLLTDNCLTALLVESRHMRRLSNWLDYRILLPGYFDDMLYELKLLNTNLLFNQLHQQALIQPAFSDVSSASFSSDIRRKLN